MPKRSLDPSLDWAPGPATVVLRVQAFPNPGAPGPHFVQEPSFSLYADGRVVFASVGGANRTSPLVDGHVTAAGMRALLAMTQASGLLDAEGADYRDHHVADAATTLFSAHVSDGVHSASVYALGGAGDEEASIEDRTGRQALTTFASQLMTLPEALGASEVSVAGPYTPAGVRLFIHLNGKHDYVEPQKKRWPLGDLAAYGRTDPDEASRCVIVTGIDLETIRPLISDMDYRSTWTSSGHTFALSVEPLLPDELSTPCQARVSPDLPQ